MVYIRAMRALSCFLAALALAPLSVGFARDNPPNSTVQGVTWHCNPGYRRVGYECRKSTVIPQPPNKAVGQGAHWYCKPGYRRVGGQCVKPQLPANATAGSSSRVELSGRVTDFTCDPGYERIGSQCQRQPTPPNAFRVGTGWICYKGYERVGDQCRKADTPE